MKHIARSVYLVLVVWLLLPMSGSLAQETTDEPPSAEQEAPTAAPTEPPPLEPTGIPTDLPAATPTDPPTPVLTEPPAVTVEPALTEPVTPAAEVTEPAAITAEATAVVSPTEATAAPTEPVVPEATPPVEPTVPLPVEPTAMPPTSWQTVVDGALDAAYWSGATTWSVLDGGLALHPTAGELVFVGQPDLAATMAAVRFRATGSTVWLSVRYSPVGTAYTARLTSTGQLDLLRVNTPLATTTVTLPTNGVHTLKLRVIDNQITVWLDDVMVIEAQDDAPLPPGTVTVGGDLTDMDGSLHLETLSIWTTDPVTEPLATVAAPTAAPVTPTITPEAEFTSEATVEAAAVNAVEQRIALPAPTAREPVDGDVVDRQRPRLRWERIRQADLYQVQVAASDDFAVLLVDETTRGTSYTLDRDQSLPEGMYFWRLRTQDETVWGSFGPTETFTIHLLSRPRVDEFTTDTTPSFSWKRADNAVSYQLEVALDDAFTQPVAGFPVMTTRTSHRLGRGEDLPYGHYYWRVNIDSGSGFVTSPFFWRFTVTPRPPDKPRLVAPNRRGLINVPQPMLMWDVVGDAVRYQVQIDDDRRFGSPAYDVLVTDPTFTVPAPLTDGRYYWRVAALNSFNAPGRWSSSYDFIIDTLPPDVPTLNDPANGAWTDDDTPRLRWERIKDAVRYEVWLNPGSVPSVSIGTTRSTGYTVPMQLLHTQYAWQVRAIDAAGNVSAWSPAYIMHIESSTRSAPALNRQTSGTVTLTWTPVSWATAYEIDIATDSKFRNNQIIHSEIVTPDTLALTLIDLPEGMYYWRVRVRQANNTRWSKWSTTGLFTVDVQES